MINDGKIVALNKQISILRKKKSAKISPEEIQLINDRIAEIKKEIDELSRPEPTIVPVVNVRTVGEKSKVIAPDNAIRL